eukprot:gene12041-14084_t
MNNSQVYDVAVLGAGVAGLYAAKLLRDRGMKVVTLEANPLLVGGRARSDSTFTQWPVELGGEMIHGQDTLYYQLAQENGWEVFETFAEDLFTSDRKSTYFYLGRERRLIGPDQMDDDMLNLFKELGAMGETPQCKTKNLMQHLVSRGVPYRMIGLADAVYSKTWATNLDKIGVRQAVIEDDKFHKIPKNFKLQGSSKVMVDWMANGAEIRKGWQAKTVEYGDTVCRVTSTKGDLVSAKRVVVAVPLRILKDGDIQFTPALPADKQEAIKVIGMDGVMKIILKFNSKFWGQRVELVLSSDSPIPQIWMDGAPQRRIPAGAQAEFVCVGFISGDQAVSIAALPEKKQVRTFLDQLDAMFGNAIEGWTPASNAYTGHLVYDWQKEPFVRGAYSYPSVIPHSSPIDSNPNHILAKSIGNRLYFAGEASAITHEMGTINGALQTGARAAKEIQDALTSKL